MWVIDYTGCCNCKKFIPTVHISTEKMIKITKSFKTEVHTYVHDYIAMYCMIKTNFVFCGVLMKQH